MVGARDGDAWPPGGTHASVHGFIAFKSGQENG